MAYDDVEGGGAPGALLSGGFSVRRCGGEGRGMQGETMERQWRVLRAIPPHPKVTTVSEILTLLQNTSPDSAIKGLNKRALERDIVILESVFGKALRIDRSAKPYRLSWAGAAHPDGRVRLTEAQAVAFILLDAHAGDALPPTLASVLRPFVVEAHGSLAQGPVSALKNWPKKLRILERRRPGACPCVEPAVLQTVCEALLQGRRLTAVYQSAGVSEAVSYELSPLGLVRAQGVYYLVATAWGYEDARHYALHRMSRAVMKTEKVRRPQGFDLDAHIAGGAFDIPFEESPMTLVLRVSATAMRYVREAPLAPDQLVSEGESWHVVQARVTDSYALRVWLLGQGADVQVVKPLRLRRWMAQTLAQALAPYQDDTRGRSWQPRGLDRRPTGRRQL